MKIITNNKRAFHDYEIFDRIEAGIVLRGDEVKSIRKGTVSINDSFAVVQDGEIVLLNSYIAPYTHAYTKSALTDRRTRKLLLNRKEIDKLMGDISRKGLTIIPLKMYFNEKSLVKLELGIAKHKKLIDKKRELREKDIKRETDRAIRSRS